MLKNQQAPSLRLWAVFAAVCAGSLALDLSTKQWAWDTLRPPGGHPVMLWEPTLELAFAYNRGSAFGVVPRLDYPLALLAITAALVGWIVVTARGPGAGRLRLAGAGMIVGGALGNLFDRFFRDDGLGHRGVVDFIKVNFPWGGSWPSFNVADAAIAVGAALLLWSLREPPATPPAS
jgi:signal peptidase II